MRIIINPGTGPCEGATPEQAEANMQAFVEAVADDIAEGNKWRAGTGVRPSLHGVRASYLDYGDGRFAFLLSETPDGPGCEVQMPGLPLEQVQDESDMWQPRVYVDGSSWHWNIGVSVAGDCVLSDGEC